MKITFSFNPKREVIKFQHTMDATTVKQLGGLKALEALCPVDVLRQVGPLTFEAEELTVDGMNRIITSMQAVMARKKMMLASCQKTNLRFSLEGMSAYHQAMEEFEKAEKKLQGVCNKTGITFQFHLPIKQIKFANSAPNLKQD